MGLVPPPTPLTEKEYNEAIASGKKYLWEIDPRLWKWIGWFARRRYLKNIKNRTN